MKKLILAVSMTGGLIALSACSSQTTNSEAIVQTKVGNISKEELYTALKDKYGEQELQQLLYEKVLGNKYKVESEELNKKFEEFKAQYGSNFEMILAQNNIKDESEFKKILKFQLLVEKAAIKDIKVTEKELKESYENYKPEIKARHILLEDEETAKEVKKKLDEGAEFEKLAKEYSKDPGSVEAGGDLGWFGSGKMVPEFENAAYSLEINQISEPIKTQNGFHIIQALEKKEKDSFEKMKNELEYNIKVSKIDDSKIQEILQKELKDANVEIKDEDLKGLLETASTKQ